MMSLTHIITTWLIFCVCLFPHTAAKQQRFSKQNSDFENTVSFGRKLVSFVSDERKESVVMTKNALIGIGEENTIELVVKIKDRVRLRGSTMEPSIVLFFAPEDAELADVSRSFRKFRKNVVAALMDKSSRGNNSTSRFLSQTIEGETRVHELDEKFSFLDNGFLKLKREDGSITAYTSADKETWNQVGDSQMLPVNLQEANLKAGLRVRRYSRKHHALSVDAQYSYRKKAPPFFNPIDTVSGQKVWDISIHVSNLCSDSTDGGLSTTLTNDLEYAILNFFNKTYDGNQNVTYDSVMILGDQFEEGISCDPIEEAITEKSRRKLPRKFLYSTIYFILKGFCYGHCPSDPSSVIDTVNRRRLQSKNEEFLGAIRSVMPSADSMSKGEMTPIDCTTRKYCNSQDGKCCGFEDCFCPYTVIEICDKTAYCSGSGCCRPAFIPKCDFSMTCDRTIDVTMDKSIIVFGQSHTRDEFPRFRVYKYDSANNKFYQHGNLPFPDMRLLDESSSSSTDRVISSSVSISNTGQRVALGSNVGRKVKIFDLDTDNEWKNTETFVGPHTSLFGQSVSLNPTTGNTIAIGAPRYSRKNDRNGNVVIYEYRYNNQSKLRWIKKPPINANTPHEEFGWRVDVDNDNIVHVGYHKNSAVVSYEYRGSVWVKVNAETDLKKCFSPSNNQCETNF